MIACTARLLAAPAVNSEGMRPDGSSAAARATAGTWRRIATEHFTLVGEVPEQTLADLALDLEALESILAGLDPGEAPRPLPAKVIVFASEAAFSRYVPRGEDGSPAAVSGFFLTHPHGDFIATGSADPRETRRVLYHEALHRFVRHHLPQAPLWLNEGLAELYSTLEIRRGEALVGSPVPAHLAHLRRAPRRPLDELIAAAGAGQAYGGAHRGGAHRDRASAFYAEAWVLTHHLLTADGGRAAMAAYTGLLRAGADPVAAFAEAFGSTGSIERAIDAHLLEPMHHPLRVGLRAPAARLATGPIVLDPADVEHELGWLLSHHAPPQTAAARRHIDAALRLDPDHAGATAAAGWLAELAGDHDTARLDYARSIELDPRDPLPRFLEAQSIARLAVTLPETERASPAAQALLPTAREGYRRSLALEADFAEAWAGLGAAWVADRAPESEGLEALREAYRRLPTRDDVLYNLTLLEARLGSRKRAATLIAMLERRAAPDQVERAREELRRVDRDGAESLER